MSGRAFLRLGVVLSLVAVLAVPLDARSQAKPARIGMLRSSEDPFPVMRDNVAALKEALAEHGYVEPGNLVIEYRYPRGATDRVRDLAAELVRLDVDVIHVAGPVALQAARAATASIPIVAHDFETDPVAAGYVASHARPGGNVTGMFLDLPELAGKWLELLRQVVPGLSRVAALWDPATGDAQVRAAQAAARALGVTLHVLEVRDAGELEARFQAAAQARAGAMVALSSPLFAGARAKQVAGLALRHRLPLMTLFLRVVEWGGVLAYGPDVLELYRQEGRLIGKILKGARPAELPIERPDRFYLTVNLKAARSFGLAVPQAVINRADRVIQ